MTALYVVVRDAAFAWSFAESRLDVRTDSDNVQAADRCDSRLLIQVVIVTVAIAIATTGHRVTVFPARARVPFGQGLDGWEQGGEKE